MSNIPKTAASVPSLREETKWLVDVHEVRHPIDPVHPISIKNVDISTGIIPAPSVPFPESHPYCEIGLNFEGNLEQFIGGEKICRSGGDIMFLGPGMPHYAMRHSYPQRSITIHLLPILLLQMGPEGDGSRILDRFTATQTIQERVVRPPKELFGSLMGNFTQASAESQTRDFGWEIRLRALLMESLVSFMRWEASIGRRLIQMPTQINWKHIEKALRYVSDHFSEPLYVQNIAEAVGLGPGNLQTVFQQALGISCMQYLKAFRISQAQAALSIPNVRVTEVALAVGFDTLSNFNSAFKSIVGMSPTAFINSIHPKQGSSFERLIESRKAKHRRSN